MAKRKSTKTVGNSSAATVGYEAQLWQMADALRGSMDAALYKHVVLGLIFLKYISDAFEEVHERLKSEIDQGADPEDPDEYRARANGHIVFSHDLDFGSLLAMTRASGPSVLQVRTQDVLPASIGEIVLDVLRQHRSELEAGAIISVDPVHDLAALGARIAHLRPMDGLETVAREEGDPVGRQVHVDDDLHEAFRGSSTSSVRQAA